MWSRVPLVRLIIPFILGILAAEHYSEHIAIPFYIQGMLATGVVLGAAFYGLLFSYATRWIYGIFIILFIACAGYYFSLKYQQQEQTTLETLPLIHASTLPAQWRHLRRGSDHTETP